MNLSALASSGTLSVRDRMAEAWAQAASEGSTLAFAADPIPPPACGHNRERERDYPQHTQRLPRDDFRCDDGRVFDIPREVDPAEELIIRLE